MAGRIGFYGDLGDCRGRVLAAFGAARRAPATIEEALAIDAEARQAAGSLLPENDSGTALLSGRARGCDGSCQYDRRSDGLVFADTVLSFLLVLTIVVFVHEFGHFWVGRRCGVGVTAFSIGFGPELFGWNDRHGTRWKLSAIPLGGYVKFVGDVNAASVPDNANARTDDAAGARRSASRTRASPKRAAIVAAGPIANFLLAIAIFAGLNYVNGRQVLEPRDRERPAGQRGRARRLPAERPRPVDRRAADRQLRRHAARGQRQRRGRILDLRGRAGGQTVTLDGHAGSQGADHALRQAADRAPRAAGLERPDDITARDLQPWGPLNGGRRRRPGTWSSAPSTIVGKLIAGRESPDQLSGPIRIAQVSGQVANAGRRRGPDQPCRRCCPSRSGSSTCSRFRCSTADTCCSTPSRPSAAARLSDGPRRSASGSGLRSW